MFFAILFFRQKGFLALTALITVTGGYWWNIIIPAKRTELALSKSKG
jgi:hypothetical protein